MEQNLSLVVADRAMIASGICRLELRRKDGGVLPPFEAGAHVEVLAPSGVVRSYSLNNDDDERHRYVIAIKRHEGGRGSASLHDDVSIGDLLMISPPRNQYAFGNGSKYLLIAGGIGITPIIAIFRRLMRQGVQDLKLIYCTRAPEDTAYLDELSEQRHSPYVHLHHSATAGGRFDFWPFLRSPDQAQIYYCGPRTLIDEVYALTIHWPRRSLHFESFAGSTADASKPFRLRRATDGEIYQIPSDRSVLDVLRATGLKPPSSCESGTCGTCRMRLVAGVPDHRDVVLSEAERDGYFMPCVSRAFGDELTLDF